MNAEDRVNELEAEVARLRAALAPEALRDTVDAVAYALDEWLGPLSADDTERACNAIHSVIAALEPTR